MIFGRFYGIIQYQSTMTSWHGNAFYTNDLLRKESSSPWWRHQMETFSALLAICAGKSPVPGEFPAQRLVTRSFDVFFDLRSNKRLSKHSWGWWFEMLSRPLWRYCDDWTMTSWHGNAFYTNDLLRKESSSHWTNYGENLKYRHVSNISRTESKHLKDYRTVLRLSLPNRLKPDVKSRMKM